MEWLGANLDAANKSGQQVWLMFHIPPGIDGYATAPKKGADSGRGADKPATCGPIIPMWVPELTSQFDGLLAKYSSTVHAGFAAHIHSDDFRLIGSPGINRKFILLGPAVSPIYKQNPGFRIVSFTSDGTVTDQATYYLTNLKCEDCAPESVAWTGEITFTGWWSMDKLDAANLSKVYDEVIADPQYREHWLDDFAVFGPAKKSEEGFVRALYCADEGLSMDAYKACYCGPR
jgi:hypothetical protein